MGRYFPTKGNMERLYSRSNKHWVKEDPKYWVSFIYSKSFLQTAKPYLQVYIFGIRRAGWTRLFEKDRLGELFQVKSQPVSQKNYHKNEHALFFLWQNPLISFFLSSTYEKSWLRRFWFNFSSASAKRCVTHHDTALLTTELYMRWKRFTNWKILTNLTEDDYHSVGHSLSQQQSNY